MKLHKIKYRNPALDTKFCYCINNYLWAKNKIQIINNGTEFLAPKYYCPRHVGQLENRRLAYSKYRARHPLKTIKKAHEEVKKERQRRWREMIKKRRTSNRYYKFTVSVSEDEYKLLWNFLYKEVRNPLKDKIRIQTIEELKEKRERKQNEK